MVYWLWLTGVRGLGPVLQNRLLDALGSPERVYEAGEEELLSLPGLGPSKVRSILESRSLDQAKRIQEASWEKGIRLVPRSSPLYPAKALHRDSPILLYVQGEVPPTYRGVAIVGSRRCSSYGREVARETSSILAGAGDLILSGMAEGIDCQAHRGALEAGGKTLALLAFGLDLCYPKAHRSLMEAIRQAGALISEYPPGTLPRPEFFPQRNRLISAFSDLVLVVEAGKESGALITAQKARAQGKEVYVVPNEIGKETGRGSNRLLLEGAKCFLGPWQISQRKEEDQEAVPSKKTPLSREEEAILVSLGEGSKDLARLARDLSMAQLDLLDLLGGLEGEGLVLPLPGGLYRKGIRGEDGPQAPD